MFDVESINRSLIGCAYVHNGVDRCKKGCKPDGLQPFDYLCGAYRNRTDDLLTASQTL